MVSDPAGITVTSMKHTPGKYLTPQHHYVQEALLSSYISYPPLSSE